MENSYGIGVTNRYELFYVDEEGSDPLETLIQIKQKINKKVDTVKSQGTTLTGNQQINKSSEKENKSATLNKNQNQDLLTKTTRPSGQNPNKKIVKEPQTVVESKGKLSRDDTKPKEPKPNDHRSSNKTDSEIRELRNNKRNRDERQSNGQQQEQQLNQQNRDDRPPRRGNFNGERRGTGGERSGIQRGEGGGNRTGGGGQRFDERRGKREFDRQSGSDKTGVKSIDKRDGAGAHNWGTHKQDLDDLNKSIDENDKDKDDSGTEQQQQQKDNENDQILPIEEEAKELTLDEWKAQRAVRAKPQFNIRKAGEGEDTSQWKKMVALNNKKKDDDDEELEYDPSMYPQRVGRQKHVLDIEFHFNDARRGGGGSGIGRGGRGGGGRGRGGPGGNRGGNGGQRRNIERTERGGGGGNGGGGVTANVETEREERGTEEVQPQQQQVRPAREQREVREPREPRGPRREHVNRNFDGFARNSQNAPKVDDEHDFPSLG